jgi:hypothetical protein
VCSFPGAILPADARSICKAPHELQKKIAPCVFVRQATDGLMGGALACGLVKTFVPPPLNERG